MRIMWLLNHTAARKFEIAMIKSLGISEIFLPKKFPQDQSFRTASIDFSEDAGLKIPVEDLEIFNETDWYGGVSADIWNLANKYFDIAFFLPLNKEALEGISRNFKGAVIWRVYGRDGSANYDKVLNDYIAPENFGGFYVRSLGRRFYFGEAYSHVADIEPPYLRDRRLYLPLGLASAEIKDQWKGEERKIYFVCPEIASSPIYSSIYRKFQTEFSGLPYMVAGAQPIAVNDRSVLGYVSDEQHAWNMRQSRVMFYHSQEPNHIHYHPFEAIRAGMPLVFMAGGMLDRMGGVGLPGRCKNAAEARRKIKRILADDWRLIESIRRSQTVLLDPMRPENCESAWREGFSRVAKDLTDWRTEKSHRPSIRARKRVAVILPVINQGEGLSRDIALAKALYLGSCQCKEDAEIVLVHLDEDATYHDGVFADLTSDIARRKFNWKILPLAEARRAMRYAGFDSWEPRSNYYMIPDDGMRQLLDCDLWLIVSDRLSYPILPIKPVVLMSYDFSQRYDNTIPDSTNMQFLSVARSAELVLVSSEFTKQDALQYAGVEPRKVKKLPMLVPEFPICRDEKMVYEGGCPYFVWAADAVLNKDLKAALEALLIYYKDLDGQWSCRATGMNAKQVFDGELSCIQPTLYISESNKILHKRVKWMGGLSDVQYRRLLAKAGFLWYVGHIYDGSFKVVEAASLGVPSLSSDYPIMREIDNQFSLGQAWMNSNSPRHMAEQLKMMELNAKIRSCQLPSVAQLAAQKIERHANAYWQEVRTCL